MKIMCNGFVLTPVPHRDLNMACIMQTYLIIYTSSPKRQQWLELEGLSGSILLHAVVKKVKVCFYTAQYPVC